MGMVNRVTSPRMALQLSAENVIVHLRCSASALTDIRLTEQPGAYKTLCSVIPFREMRAKEVYVPHACYLCALPIPELDSSECGG